MITTITKFSGHTLNENTIDIIISFLSLNVQSKINKKYCKRVEPIAIKKIIQAIKFNRNRMHKIMQNNRFCSTEFLRAHHILYYPHEYRYTYFRRALMILVLLRVDIDFIEFEQYLEVVNSETINTIGLPTNYLFKKLINLMNTQELLLCNS